MTKKPLFHFTPPKNWMNDPNGLCFYKGEYHIFYQHNPKNPYWGNMTWGHGKSKNLFQWEHLPYALSPEKDFPDEDGCFSGSAIEKDGDLYLIYTGIVMTEKKINEHGNEMLAHDDAMISTQLFAKSEDGVNFKKDTSIKILAPENCCKAHFRDPKVWKNGDTWYMVVGAKEKNEGKILIYKSKDFREWVVLSEIKKDNLGFMWECPDLFTLSDKEVLIFSPQGIGTAGQEHVSGYFLGDLNYENGEYSGDEFTLLDCGFEFYAPQTFTDEKDRRILIGWLVNHAPLPGEDWTGMMTIPRELKVIENKLYSYPIDELLEYRKNYNNLVVSKNESFTYEVGNSFDMELKVNPVNDFEINLFNNNSEGLKIFWNSKENTLTLDRSQVLNGFKPLETFGTERKLVLPSKDLLEFRIIADKSVVEIFINKGEYVMSAVINPNENQNKIFFLGDFQDVAIWNLEI